MQQQLEDLDEEYEDQMVADFVMQLDTVTSIQEPRRWGGSHVG
jgi:hypothetical protein